MGGSCVAKAGGSGVVVLPCGAGKTMVGAAAMAKAAATTLILVTNTVAGRQCFQWCRGQPEAFAERTGKPDIRGAYGLHGREMIAWLTQLQHTRGKNVIFVGILDEKVDDFNRKLFVPQITADAA